MQRFFFVCCRACSGHEIEQRWRPAQAACAASPFADRDAFLAALLPAAERQRLQQLKEAREQDCQKAAALQLSAGKKLAELQARALTERSLADLARDLEEQEAQVYACVATDYGQALLPRGERVTVSAARLDREEEVARLWACCFCPAASLSMSLSVTLSLIRPKETS